MDYASDKQRKTIVTFVALVIIAAVTVGAVAVSPKKSVVTVVATSAGSAASPGSGSNAGSGATAATYKDGSYTATGSYESPGGNEQITISVTLKGGVITDSSAKSGAQDPDAEEYQSDFIGGYKPLIVGKNISSVSLSRVSGSSLTSQGFNDAINQIKSQAQA